MKEEEIILNKISQDIISLEDGIIWFDNLNLTEKKDIIIKLSMFVSQTKPKEKIELGLIFSPPYKRSTSSVILEKYDNTNVALSKIITLPDNELKNSFISLMRVFKVCDKIRRETECKDGCTHYWHNLQTI